MDEKGKILYMNVALLEQMNSPLLENLVAKEAFSFEQLLEVVSIEENEKNLEAILKNPCAREILKNIGKDSQNWQAKLQYLMNLEIGERTRVIEQFGVNGESLVQEELKRREEWFDTMERGYFEDEEYGIIDCDIDPPNLCKAIFGLSYEEAKELIKKYGIDSNQLSIQTDEDKKVYRKLQILKELTTPKEFESYEEERQYYTNHYDLHREELLALSKDVSAFFKVDLEKSFLDLYARQYDRTLGVQKTRRDNVSYDGKIIPIYEASGDFMLLIREEQNVSPENKQNFWNATKVGVNGLCQCTIGQDYIRAVNSDQENACLVASTSCSDGELRMASTTNIKSKGANVALSNIGVKSDYGNGVVFRTPQEQINHSRGTNNETNTSRNVYNPTTGLFERKPSEYVVYIQDTDDMDIAQDSHFKTVQFVASQTGWPILVVPREKCAQREEAKIQVIKEKILGNKERSQEETDESLIKEMIVKFNNNREGILTSKGLKEKYFTEEEHLELVGIVNARLSNLMSIDLEQYDQLVQTVSQIYKEEIDKYYVLAMIERMHKGN